MTYHGHENDFVKSSYSLTLFETYFRVLLDVLNPCSSSFLNFFVALLLLKNLWVSSLNCPKFTKMCPFLFKLYACPDNYADI